MSDLGRGGLCWVLVAPRCPRSGRHMTGLEPMLHGTGQVPHGCPSVQGLEHRSDICKPLGFSHESALCVPLASYFVGLPPNRVVASNKGAIAKNIPCLARRGPALDVQTRHQAMQRLGLQVLLRQLLVEWDVRDVHVDGWAGLLGNYLVLAVALSNV